MRVNATKKRRICSRGHVYFGSAPCPKCWPGYRTSRASSSREVDAYIAKAPEKVRGKLMKLRAAIRGVAPAALESISYRIPFYSYKGRLAWFARMKGHIGLYLRPPVIAEHQRELARFKTTKSAVHFPLDGELPLPLVRKLVRSRMRMNEAGE